MVEDYNPPCAEMSENIADNCSTRSGEPLERSAFARAARRLRGVVGVVDVPGEIRAGDAITVAIPE